MILFIMDANGRHHFVNTANLASFSAQSESSLEIAGSKHYFEMVLRNGEILKIEIESPEMVEDMIASMMSGMNRGGGQHDTSMPN